MTFILTTSPRVPNNDDAVPLSISSTPPAHMQNRSLDNLHKHVVIAILPPTPPSVTLRGRSRMSSSNAFASPDTPKPCVGTLGVIHITQKKQASFYYKPLSIYVLRVYSILYSVEPFVYVTPFTSVKPSPEMANSIEGTLNKASTKYVPVKNCRAKTTAGEQREKKKSDTRGVNGVCERLLLMASCLRTSVTHVRNVDWGDIPVLRDGTASRSQNGPCRHDFRANEK